MPRTKQWQPMERTVDLIRIWYSKLANADINAKELTILQECILEDSAAFRPLNPDTNGKLTYSDKDHSRREALLDFVLAVSHCLSDKELYRLTSVVLALQYQDVKSSGPNAINTFLRNNELARYLIMVEMGKSCDPKKRELPQTTLAHLKTLANDYSDTGLANLVNNIFISGFNQFKESYYGLRHIDIPKEISIKQMESIRDKHWDISKQIKDRHPNQPRWLNYPQINRDVLTKNSVFKSMAYTTPSKESTTPTP